MSETIPDLRALPRREAYAIIRQNTESVLNDDSGEIAAMATIATLVHHSLGFLWTGFYRVVASGKLQVGPYQGSLGCIEIEFGRGVCGTAASERKPVIVEDVANFPGHISCDARARSEIVLPVFDRSNELIAVFDVDAETPAAFSNEDKDGLEKILGWFSRS